MDGALIIRKHSGPTSHDIVNQVRRLFGQKKVGHAGTLDPMATGVLLVCLGKATRLVEYLMGAPKEYRARLVLGQSTDTQDSSGTVISERDASSITREDLEGIAAAFVGEIEQVPPMISAIKHQGKPLYKHAREGVTIERAPRPVTIYSINTTDFTPGPRAEAELIVNCSSGTYIRTLCSDIGDKLGCGGHMSALERTRVGRFAIEDAITVDELTQAADGRLEAQLISMADAIQDIPAVILPEEAIADILHGTIVPSPDCEDMPSGATVRMLSRTGDLIGLGTLDFIDGGPVVKPKKVLVDHMP
ncbi:MAG: tRNA pseudouridine(55) synthase TruB [Armatimonadetes bacterium]|nr:tRNA pseudouridine(55) synthase TruB [Armatimonadota bacterium]